MRRVGRFDQTLTTFLLLLRTLNVLSCDSYLWNSSSRGWTFQDAIGSTWNIIDPLLFCNWKHTGCTKTKAILFEVVPITRPSFLKLHLNKGYLILKMGPLKFLFYLTFVNWCTKGESPNKIRNVNVFGWNEIQKVELIILKTGILDTNRSTLFAYYMRWRESQKKSIFYLAWVKLFFMFPLQLCGRCSADRFEEQPGLQHRLHCHQHYRHG